jgi:putative ubiquitin-RnfH superfamily antitoxin RatB of RatAB toxin-antitoxin module
MRPAETGPIGVVIAWVEAGGVRTVALTVPAGTRLGEALVEAVARERVPAAVVADPQTRGAVFGRLRKPDHVLHEGDRIELLGPLLVDPKVARARRVQQRRMAGRD